MRPVGRRNATEVRTTESIAGAPDHAVTATLVAERRRFLGFLINRVGDPDLAEDLLQTAVLRAVRSSEALRDEERVVAWIYRILRNVVTDHQRHWAATSRAEASAAALEILEEPESDLEGEICACVGVLLGTLPGQHAEVLRLVEIDDLSPAEVARKIGHSAGNVRVRLHRARLALRERVEQLCRTCAKHGCLDCTCSKPPAL